MKANIELRLMTCDIRWSQYGRRFGWLTKLVLLSMFASGYSVYAQSKRLTDSSSMARDDHSALRVRYPNPNQLHDLQTDREYQYGHDTAPPDNPVARFFSWLFRKVAEFLGSEAYQNVWQYVLLAGIVGLVIYLLMKAEVLTFLFPKKAQSSGLDYETIAENIHAIDFDAAVEEAIVQRNFRLAVRLLYLQTLKRLSDAGLIAYKPDKTNRQYVYELTNSPIQTEFEQLTRQFEFVWYGNFSINETRYATLQTQFRQFFQNAQSATITHNS